MSQVNKCHSVLFPPPIYLASVRNRVQLPNVSLASTIVFPQLGYLTTRRTELLWFSTSKSPLWLSNVDVSGTQNISTWQANKLHDCCVLCHAYRQKVGKDTCQIFLQFPPFNDVGGTLTYVLT